MKTYQTIISEMINIPKGINSRLNDTQEQISDLEDRADEISENVAQRGRQMKG